MKWLPVNNNSILYKFNSFLPPLAIYVYQLGPTYLKFHLCSKKDILTYLTMKIKNPCFWRNLSIFWALKVQNIKVRIVLLAEPVFWLQFKEKQGVSYLIVFQNMSNRTYVNISPMTHMLQLIHVIIKLSRSWDPFTAPSGGLDQSGLRD